VRNGRAPAGERRGDSRGKLDGLGRAYRLGLLGAALGVIAGLIQWAFGSEIPDWTGEKLHPEQLGLITIALSALALVSIHVAIRRPHLATPRRAFLAGVGVLAPAAICFTTVGRLWYLPGTLLLVAGALILLAPRREGRSAS
jgi:hypothetical protein